MHVSKPPENAYVKQMFDSFSNVAKEMGVSIGLKHKKINISNPREMLGPDVGCMQLSRVRITAATLSELPVAPELFENNGGLHDTRTSVKEKTIHRSIKLVAESLAELSDHTVDVHVQHESIDGLFTFYDSSRATLNIYQVASVTFDLLLLLAVGAYLILLLSFLVIITRGLDDLINMFRKIKGT